MSAMTVGTKKTIFVPIFYNWLLLLLLLTENEMKSSQAQVRSHKPQFRKIVNKKGIVLKVMPKAYLHDTVCKLKQLFLSMLIA